MCTHMQLINVIFKMRLLVPVFLSDHLLLGLCTTVFGKYPLSHHLEMLLSLLLCPLFTDAVNAKSLQWCLTLYDPMDCSPPGSSVPGTLQERVLEWVVMPSSRTGEFFTTSATWEARAVAASFLAYSLVAQMVKNPPAMQETRVQSLGWEDPLEKGMATHSSILAWRIPPVPGSPSHIYFIRSVESPETWSITTACLRHRWHWHFEESWVWFRQCGPGTQHMWCWVLRTAPQEAREARRPVPAR